MLCLSGFELYSRWVPLISVENTFIVHSEGPHCSRVTPKQAYNICLFLRKPNPRKNDSRSREMKIMSLDILLSGRRFLDGK